MPWRRSSSRSCSVMPGTVETVASLMLFPLEMTALPRPHQTFREQQDEDEHGNERARRQPREGDRKRQQEQHLDIEDQEENGVEIVVRLELNPGVASWRDAALVNIVFHRARFRRLEK